MWFLNLILYSNSSATNEIQEDSNELTDFGNSELETAENVKMLCISDSMESCIENEIKTIELRKSRNPSYS
jgi:hypothetical protein